MPYGTPRTEKERRDRHILLYGEEPPDERRGLPAIIPKQSSLGNGDWVDSWVADGDETLMAPVVIPIIGVKIGAGYAIAGAAMAATGIVHAVDVWREKRRRKNAGLPAQPKLTIQSRRDPKTGAAKLKFTIRGAYPGRRILLKMGKGKFYGIGDPIIADRMGDGTIELDGEHILEEAKKKRIIDIGMPKVTSGTKRVWVYAQEVRPRLGDLRSPITLVEIEVKGVAAKMKEEITTSMLGFRTLTTKGAAELIKEGKPCYIKSMLPIISMFPGLPYTPGMWVPPACVITDTQ